MGKKHFHFNPFTLRFEAPKHGLRHRLLHFGLPALLAVVLSFGIRYSLGRHLSNPKEIKLLAEKEVLVHQYLTVEERVQELETSLKELQHRDDNIYRAFYEMEPISSSLRDAGLGGSERYSNLEGYESSVLMLGLTKRIDMAGVGMDIPSAGASVIATLSNIGPGLGSVGPVDNFAHVPALGKLVLAFCMLLGRLELFTVLVLVFPSFWRK